MGLEIEFEYVDTADGVWSPAEDVRPLSERLTQGRDADAPAGNPLIVQFGIALAALTLGAASMAGFLAGHTAAHDRSVTLLHLAPSSAYVVPPLPQPPTRDQSPEQLLATPWTNVADQDVSLSVINDGSRPVTMLGATISSLDFDVTSLAPASGAPTAPGDVSTLRGRAHFVCGDHPANRTSTVANLRARTADGVVRQETLEVDHFSEIAERSVCSRMPTPQVIRSTRYSPAPPAPPSHTMGLPDVPALYIAEITAANRAPFPLRMDLPQAAAPWAGSGLLLTTSGDTVIPPHGIGTITISVSVTDCPNALAMASGNDFSIDVLDFSDGRDPVSDPQARSFDQTLPIADPDAITKYCLAHGAMSGSVISR